MLSRNLTLNLIPRARVDAEIRAGLGDPAFVRRVMEAGETARALAWMIARRLGLPSGAPRGADEGGPEPGWLRALFLDEGLRAIGHTDVPLDPRALTAALAEAFRAALKAGASSVWILRGARPGPDGRPALLEGEVEVLEKAVMLGALLGLPLQGYQLVTPEGGRISIPPVWAGRGDPAGGERPVPEEPPPDEGVPPELVPDDRWLRARFPEGIARRLAGAGPMARATAGLLGTLLELGMPRTALGLQRTALWAADLVFLEQEALAVLLLERDGGVMSRPLIALGSAERAAVDLRAVFRAAVRAGAAGLALLHNHPEGEPWPSGDDAAMAEVAAVVGKALGLPVLDLVVVSPRGWASLRWLRSDVWGEGR